MPKMTPKMTSVDVPPPDDGGDPNDPNDPIANAPDPHDPGLTENHFESHFSPPGRQKHRAN